MISPKRYQTNLEPMRWSRNGMLPNAGFIAGANGAIGRQNHILSYRKKTFITTGDFDNPPTGLVGDTVLYRTYCHTGHGTTHIGFVVGMGKASTSATDPRIDITCTISGGAATTTTVRYGLTSASTLDPPNHIAWFRPTVAVTADTRYEIAVTAKNYARPVSLTAYEIGADVVDSSVNYFNENQVSVGYPVFDSLRSASLIGLSQMFRHNGSHLLTWPGAVDGVSPTFTTTTWTNLLDGSTSVSAATPGYYLGGDSDTYLSQHCRQSDGQVLDVVFAVHGSMSAGTGEVRLEDSTGTRCSITGIDTTSKWHVATTTISAVDTMGKVDLQARIAGTPPDTLTVNAVALFAYIA